ncbi:MAG: hypothetical protein V4697_02390 [Patescibacteria group bacterium]
MGKILHKVRITVLSSFVGLGILFSAPWITQKIDLSIYVKTLENIFVLDLLPFV